MWFIVWTTSNIGADTNRPNISPQEIFTSWEFWRINLDLTNSHQSPQTGRSGVDPSMMFDYFCRKWKCVPSFSLLSPLSPPLICLIVWSHPDFYFLWDLLLVVLPPLTLAIQAISTSPHTTSTRKNQTQTWWLYTGNSIWQVGGRGLEDSSPTELWSEKWFWSWSHRLHWRLESWSVR